MNKAQVSEAVATALNTTKAEAQRIVDTVVSVIIKGAKEDGEAVVSGLGKLKVVDKEATSGTTMGKAWSKPAHKAFKLVVSKEGKGAL
jgi:nucleoid DNA-binding protein